MDLFGFLGLGSSVTIDIKLNGIETRKSHVIHTEKGPQKIPIYTGDEPVSGTVFLVLPSGKKVDHEGIKLELVGEIGVVYDRGNHHEFITQLQELAQPGTLSASTKFDFEFSNTERQYESYNGLNVRLRYYLRCTILTKGFSSNVAKEQDFWVINFQQPPEINNSIKMEVGIEDCLHIEFEYARSKYHLKDVILGKIYFLLVRIKVKYMEVALVKRESTGTAPNLYNESETLTKFEIMDGAPVRGESIPIRLFLGAFDLTPTYKNIHNKFSVKYFLNLVLVDEEDRRYFKQTDITLWRKQPTNEAHRVVTVREAEESLAEAKKQRRKKRKNGEDKDAAKGDDGEEIGEDKKEREKFSQGPDTAESKKDGEKEKEKAEKQTDTSSWNITFIITSFWVS